MKTYLKSVFLLSILITLSSFTKLNKDPNQKILMSRLYVNKSAEKVLKEAFLLYDDGSYNYDIRNGVEGQEPLMGKLTKQQFFKIKKLLNGSNVKYLNKKYECTDGAADAGDFLFSIFMPAVQKKVQIHEGCSMPKGLRELDSLINDIIRNQ